MTPLPARQRLPADERRVRRARVRPAAPGGAWALRQAMEDALRCASFGDAGRLVLVRRLRITSVPAGAGGVLLARALERAWREAARTAVPALGAGDMADAPEALQAPAVWFASHADAALAALARTVACAPLAAWFWPLAVPVLAEARAPAARVRALVALLQALAPRSWAQAVARWPPARRGALQGWMEDLRIEDVPVHGQMVASVRDRELRGDAWQMSGDRTPRSAVEPGAAPASRQPHMPPDASRQAPAPPSWRVQAGLPMARMAARVHPAEPGAPARLVPVARAADAGSQGTPPFSALPAALPASRARRLATPPAPGAARGVPPPSAAPPSQPPAAHAPAVHAPLAPPDLPWLHDAAFSPHAGALWLVNLLDAVGFGAAQPCAGEAAAVLGGLFRTAALPADDPHWTLLPPEDPPVPATDSAVRRWQLRARRALRRHAGLSVAALASRPGWLACTLTHADVLLQMDAVDLRIRRCGLDRDPGYVPWLGRILCFHFMDRAQWPAPAPRDG